jgi:hypothetical protein
MNRCPTSLSSNSELPKAAELPAVGASHAGSVIDISDDTQDIARTNENNDNAVVDVRGDNDIVDVSGDNAVVDVRGDNDVVDVSGDNAVVEVSGDNAVVVVRGDNDVVDGSGDNAVVDGSGDNDVVDVSGDNDDEVCEVIYEKKAATIGCAFCVLVQILLNPFYFWSLILWQNKPECLFFASFFRA